MLDNVYFLSARSAGIILQKAKVALIWCYILYLRPNSSHSYERACSLRSQARDLFFFASGTLSFNLFSPGSQPNPNENIKVISAIWSNCFFVFFLKCHCCFIYLLYLIDSISRDARRESPGVIELHVFHWIREELDAFLSTTKIKAQS